VQLHTQRIPTDNRLQPGANVLAVEIHQHTPNSSDLRFELAVDGWADLPPARIVRGPFLQSGTHTGAILRWRTDRPTESRADVGRDPAQLDLQVSVPGTTTEHEVTVTGLLPETTYHYRVEGGPIHAWTTSPAPGTPATSRIWVLGDSGRPGELLSSVRDSFYTWHGSPTPDLWLMLGDNAYNDGTDAEHQAAIFDVFPETLATTVLWPTLGNHEGHSCSSVLGLGPYYDIFTLPRAGEAGGMPSGTEAYYSFDYANIHFICLNSFDIDRSVTSPMYDWLTADLAAASRHWTIAFWHHPPYSKGSHDSDIELELIEMREIFLPLLEQAGVDLVLTGHSHAYERSFLVDGHYGKSDSLTPAMKIDAGDGRPAGDGPYDKTASGGAVYTVAGCSSSPGGGTFDHPVKVVSVNQLGSLVLDVAPDQIDVTYLDHQANAFDQFRIVKRSE
jgi:hypothetical protein